MTTELKPCPFCNYALSMSEGICPAQDCTDEDTGKWTFTGICCPSCAAFLPKKDENSSVPHGVAAWNTRAVPDVPDLVRYTIVTNIHGWVLEEDLNGKYVRHDQAAAVIAAKDGRIDAQVEEIARLGSDIEAMQKRAEEAEAKLTQIEKQEPVSGDAKDIVDRLRQQEGYNRRLCIDAAMMIEYLYTKPVASDAELRAKVDEYFAAEAEYKAAVKPSGGFGHPKILRYHDPLVQRMVAARAALNPSEPRDG